MKSYQAFHTSQGDVRYASVQHHLTHLQEGSEVVLIGQEEVARTRKVIQQPTQFATPAPMRDALFASADISAYVCPSVASISAKQQSQPKPPPPPPLHPWCYNATTVTPCNTSTGSPHLHICTQTCKLLTPITYLSIIHTPEALHHLP
ncbi:hypothetical protein ECG_08163 [Echinococcus granulosus]|nr:hypothetical protein ECG_08163 [Echinococcus granulosus]